MTTESFKTFGSFLLSVFSVVPGIYFFTMGLNAYRMGTIIPAGMKHGELTGIQAMIIGGLMLFIAVGSLALEVRRVMKHKKKL